MNAAIGVMFAGDPTARATWSGTPSGIVSGLKELGVDVHGINVDAPRQTSRWFSLMAGGMMIVSGTRAPSSTRNPPRRRDHSRCRGNALRGRTAAIEHFRAP